MQQISNGRHPENNQKNQKEDKSPTLSVQEILLLNKSSGLPIFSRAYKETSGKDPTLIAGLMAAIVQFGEMIGNDMELNDIGVQEGSRIFVRSHVDLVCLLTIGNFPFTSITSQKYVSIVNELCSRIFETIQMMLALPISESGNVTNGIIFEVTDTSLEGRNASIFPELGKIVDNIVLETTTLFIDEEEVEQDLDAFVEKELYAMEESDSTYLTSEYSGTTREIKKDKKKKLMDFFSIFSRFNE